MIIGHKRTLLSNTKALGKWGEKRCEKFLKSKGLKTLARNYSCRTGEIDLVMADTDGTIVFVEVKTRAGEAFASAEDGVTFAKKSRLTRAAKFFLQTHRIENRPCRFDIVIVILSQDGQEQIRHYKSSFAP